MKMVLLSGGVGGARLARGLARIPDVSLTVIVNTGDDGKSYGLDVSPDLDTVQYSIAGVNGPHGWGVANDAFTVMAHLAEFNVDTSFQIGDADLATKLFRTQQLAQGVPLSQITAAIGKRLKIDCSVLPMSDQPVRTTLLTDAGWLSFREYFVERGHRDRVTEIAFRGAAEAEPAPGVLAAMDVADAIVIAPSNPVLSIWPILSIPGVRERLGAKRPTIAISPLFGGVAVKGPTHHLLQSLNLGEGNAGVLTAYDGLVHDFIIDENDAAEELTGPRVHAADTRLATMAQSVAFGKWLVARLAP